MHFLGEIKYESTRGELEEDMPWHVGGSSIDNRQPRDLGHMCERGKH